MRKNIHIFLQTSLFSNLFVNNNNSVLFLYYILEKTEV